MRYYDYFIDGLNLLLDYIITNYLVIIGFILFVLGIKLFLKITERKKLDSNSENVINEIRTLDNYWMYCLFSIILGAYLIIKNV
ncbi:hypothetical protein SAMN05216503_1172 [Polaribacter sp. KT25b]|nr:hypothetical protein SAMN05216503_1172 [Polaribacter sp. KT25b]